MNSYPLASDLSQKRMTLEDVGLYVILSSPPPGKTYEVMVEEILSGGADMIQLRDKKLSASLLVDLGKRLKLLCAEYGALFIVNDRPDVALACGADGVHLGHEDLSVGVARRILGHHRIIGRSAHSVDQALEVQRQSADYISCSPIFRTPTKPKYKPVGLELIREYKKGGVHVPFFALGGIDLSNVNRVMAAGAERIAVVRSVCQAADPRTAAQRFKEKILNRIAISA